LQCVQPLSFPSAKTYHIFFHFLCSLEFKPIQFPEPVKYDESNVMRGPAISAPKSPPYQSLLPSRPGFADPPYSSPLSSSWSANPPYSSSLSSPGLSKPPYSSPLSSPGSANPPYSSPVSSSGSDYASADPPYAPPPSSLSYNPADPPYSPSSSSTTKEFLREKKKINKNILPFLLTI
jgi:hypothetical protein